MCKLFYLQLEQGPCSVKEAQCPMNTDMGIRAQDASRLKQHGWMDGWMASDFQTSCIVTMWPVLSHPPWLFFFLFFLFYTSSVAKFWVSCPSSLSPDFTDVSQEIIHSDMHSECTQLLRGLVSATRSHTNTKPDSPPSLNSHASSFFSLTPSFLFS